VRDSCMIDEETYKVNFITTDQSVRRKPNGGKGKGLNLC